MSLGWNWLTTIATENGWNLYLCGNGGMRPRHADLFASDIDSETLIKYIDRFLMFYVRTADRLQRTSVWMENMQGGLNYLKQVIVTIGIVFDVCSFEVGDAREKDDIEDFIHDQDVFTDVEYGNLAAAA